MEDVFIQTQRIREASEGSLKEMCAPPISLIADLRHAFEKAVTAAQGDRAQGPRASAPKPSASEYDSLELLRQRAEAEVQSLRLQRAGAGESAQSLSELQEELLEQGAALEHVKALERARSEEEARYASRKRAAETAEAEYRKYGKLSVAKQLKLDGPHEQTGSEGEAEGEGAGKGGDAELPHHHQQQKQQQQQQQQRQQQQQQQLTEPLFFVLCELETWKGGDEGIAPFAVEVTAATKECPRSPGGNKSDGNNNGIAAVHPWRVVARFGRVSVGFTHLVNLGLVAVKAWADGEREGKGVEGREGREGSNRGEEEEEEEEDEDEEYREVPLESVFPEGGDGRTLPTLESVYYVYKALGGRGHHCERIEREWYPEEAVGRPYAWAQMLAGIQPSNVREAKYISVLEFLEGINKLNLI